MAPNERRSFFKHKKRRSKIVKRNSSGLKKKRYNQNRCKMPREVELKLNTLLTERDMTQADLAKRVGVSKNTVAAYCDDSWTVLDRTVLERIADVFQCDVGSLLETKEESDFFKTFRNHTDSKPSCTYLRRPDSERLITGRRVGHRDYRAIDQVDRLLSGCVDGMIPIENSATNLEEFRERVQQDCVVLGSPMVNKATEMAICQAFGVEPFQDGAQGKVPFHFRVGGPRQSLPASSIIQPSPDGKVGIWLKEGKQLLEMHFTPRDQFRKWETKKGRDCAVILVLNHQPAGQSHYRKLIVLAGSGGVGTEGAAMALVDSYRDLEPRGDENLVWGAIEVFFEKLKNSPTRDIKNYIWRYRRGGRCPLAFTLKKT
jgi:transcriptional regulator with XRE-family HTH domain